MIGQVAQGCPLRVDFDDCGPGHSGRLCKAGRGVDRGRRAYRHKHLRGAGCFSRGFECRPGYRLPEPDNVGPQQSAAMLTKRRPVFWAGFGIGDYAALETSVALDVAMELDDGFAAGALMEPIDILRDEREPRLHRRELGERKVRGIWIGSGDQAAPPLIPIPDERRVLRKRARCRKRFGIVLRPEAGLRVPERWHTAGCGNARSRQDEPALSRDEALGEAGR